MICRRLKILLSETLQHAFLAVLCGLSIFFTGVPFGPSAHAAPESRFSDQPIPLEKLPDRPKPIFEFGTPFLGQGTIGKGIEIPTGAVWNPTGVVFGTYRSALQVFDNATSPQQSEWANRLDLFGNVYLTRTERILIGLNSLDREGKYSGYNFKPRRPSRLHGWQDETNVNITTLFFEGDFGELFPNLDPHDRYAHDLGFSVGRQPLSFQEGIILNDTVDSVGISRNNLKLPGFSNFQITGLYGWGDVHRNDNRQDNSAELYGLFLEADHPFTTLNLDTVYVSGSGRTGDQLVAGASAVQRIGLVNTAFRVASSFAPDGETAQVTRGTLILAEISFTPTGTHDLAYLNGYYGIKNFASAARAPDAGGPLGRVGILFAARGIGRFGAPLNNRPGESAGGSVGYQKFFDNNRQQLILEAGGRFDTDGSNTAAGALGARYQIAVGQHVVLQVDGFVVQREKVDDDAFGLRFEFVYKF